MMFYEAATSVRWNYAKWVEVVKTLEREPGNYAWKWDDNLVRSRYKVHPALEGLKIYGRVLSFMTDVTHEMADCRVTGSAHWVIRKVIGYILRDGGKDEVAWGWLKGLSRAIELMDGEMLESGQILLGLERCSPPAQWDKDGLLKDLHTWVGPVKKWGGREHVRRWVEDWLERKKVDWERTAVYKTMPTLDFEQFCSDPARWATSGGGPRADWGEGEKTRSKWGWALRVLRDGLDVYGEACKLPNVAHAALKEEPQKTRLVITTPMQSYLRQAYVMYRTGMPELRSPIYSRRVLDELENYRYLNYVSLDAKRFDHQIPLWFIKKVMKNIFEAAGCNTLWRDEEEHLRGLRVELFGESCKYEGGVLSGWRLTSFIGTLASQCLCDWLVANGVDTEYIVQGDDVLLYSNTPYDMTQVKQLVDEFELEYDVATMVAKQRGVFLRRVYGGVQTLMSAGRIVRSLFYANPWIERLQYTSPESLATTWKQFISRFPWKDVRMWLLERAAQDMARWSRWPGWTTSRWFELLTTDSGLGGLGTADSHIGRDYIPQITERPDQKRRICTNCPWRKLLSYFVPTSGPIPSREVQLHYEYNRVAPYNPQTLPVSACMHKIWNGDENKTRVCMDIVTGGFKAATETIKRAAPHWLRRQPWWRVLDWIFKPNEISAPQHLSIQPSQVGERLYGVLHLVNSKLRTVRGSAKSKKMCLYLSVLAVASKTQFLVGSW